ncbi:MAG: hypothetical protein AAFQ94_23605 [Bacteroidota bacterium]
MKIKLYLLTLIVVAVSVGIPAILPEVAAINYISAAVGLIIGIAGIALFYSPLEKLKSLSEEIAKGNLNIKSEIDKSNEFGGIAEQLDNTASLLLNKIEDQKTFNQRIKDSLKIPFSILASGSIDRCILSA